MSLKNNKHIPVEYFLSSRSQRLALLQGLMDTDGYVDKWRGICEFCQKKGQLADDVYTLLRSLGYKPLKHEYAMILKGRNVGRKIRITFVPNKGDKIFRLPRKQERIDNKTTADRKDKTRLFITNISDAGKKRVNCIEVEGGMYLAGFEMVPTHNSQGSSRFLPSQMLGINPDLKIGILSYADTIAKDFNRDCQRIIDSPEYAATFPDTRLNGSNVVTVADSYLRNSSVFEIVGHRGGLRAVGRGGALTSKTLDVAIMDDLFKDSKEGNSPVVRDAAWDWYTKVVRTRLHNDSQELIVFTRWHEDDIIGRILKSEPYIKAERWSDLDGVPDNTWVLVNFEAIKTGEPTEIDPRQAGEALWPARHSLEKLMALRDLDPVGFECLHQGNPGSAEGRLFGPFKTWTSKEDFGVVVRSGCYVDVADEGSDYLCAITYDVVKSPNVFYNEKTGRMEALLFALVTDVEYTDEGTEVTEVTVPRLINSNGTQKAWIESNNGGRQFARTVEKKVRASVVAFYQSDNKESRIVTNAAFVNQQVIMPLGWDKRYPAFYDHVTKFLRQFSANKSDDGIDCMVGVWEKEIAPGNAMPYSHANRGVSVR